MKKSLLVLAAVALLASCGGGTSTSSTPTTSSTEATTSEAASSVASSEAASSAAYSEAEQGDNKSDSSSEAASSIEEDESSVEEDSSEEEIDLLEGFFAKLDVGNFTMTDADWLTLYVYGDDALYYDYAQGDSSGYVLYEGEFVYSYILEDGAVKLTGDETPEDFGGGTLLNDFTTPFLLLDYGSDTWEAEETGVYTSTDDTLKMITTILGSYGSSAYSYVDEVTLTIEDDLSAATLSATIDTGEKTYPINLTIDSFGTTQNDAVDAYLADPYEYVKPVAPVDYLGTYEKKLAEARNFTAVVTSDEDPWNTFYGISDAAVYNDYSDAATEYGVSDTGILMYDGNVYSYGLDSEGALKNLTFKEVVDPTYPSVYDYYYTPLDGLGATWEYVSGTTYTTTDAGVAKFVAAMAGYSSYSSYIDSVLVTFAEDSSTAEFEAESSAFGATVTVSNIGTTAIKGVTDYFASPYVPVAKTDWTDETKALFNEYFGEVIPFYSGFSAKMVETDYMDSYGMYYIEDSELGSDDCVAYAAVLAEAGYTLDEEETEIDTETGELSYIYYKTRNDGKQIIVQSEYVPVSELSSDSQALYPNGRFQIIISLYTPPKSYTTMEEINAALKATEIFPEMPEITGATFEALDYAESASDDMIVYTIYLELTITFETAEGLTAWQSAYVTTLEANGFAYDDYYEDYENENYDSVAFEISASNPLVLTVEVVSYTINMDW